MKKLFFFMLRLCVASVFVYAGLMKILDPNAFYKSVLAYQILPEQLSYFIAYFLPTFEVVLGLALLLKKYSKCSAVWLLTLTSIFIIALLSAYLRGLDINCGCFGEVEFGGYATAILKNILLLLALSAILLTTTPSKSHPEWLSGFRSARRQVF